MGSRTGSLAVAVLVVGALLITSCSRNSSGPDSEVGPVTDTKPYGSLTIGMDLGGTNIDPQIATATAFFFTSVAIFDALIFVDSKNELKPGIAERWEISPDGKTHTFYIRKGAKFHDGSDLTGEDVKFSIERMMAPASIVPDANAWRDAVAGVDLKDQYTVALRMKSPQFELLKGYDAGMAAVVPKKYIEEKGVDYFRTHLVGSGPWKVVRFIPGDRLEIEAVENHWRAAPKFKNLTLLHITQDATKVAMLKTGELDIAQVGPDSVPGLKAAGNRVLSWDGGGQFFGFPFYDKDHPDKYEIGDVRVRKSLQLSLNNKEIADKILGGYGEPYALWAADPTAYFWDANMLKPDPYDPEGAKRLLAEAGLPNGFKTRIYDIGGGGVISTIDQAVSGYWRKIGVIAEIIPMDYGAFFPKFNPTQLPEVWPSIYINLGSPARHFEKMRDAYYTKGNRTTKNPKLDQLLDKVPAITDPVEKKKVALEAAVMAQNEYSVLRLTGAHIIVALGPKVGDFARFRYSSIIGVMFETITHAK
ncbi:MAG: ABC transporter substrate-binding protein [Dehalococcoidia bacterium]|nr:ABC transporter substrate-binding protein [Dehalococcoidia bacterium]